VTHSLHREGSIDSLKKDYVLFIYPAKGLSDKGCIPKVRRLLEILYRTGPANVICSDLRRNPYDGVLPEEVLAALTERARVFSVFDDREKIKTLLKQYKDADQGISIVVSGLIDEIREITAEIGIEPHTINLSLGIHGNVNRLPGSDVRECTSMCGHGMVSPLLVNDVIRRVKTGKIGTWDGSLVLAGPCACGIYNPFRSQALLEEMVPIYTVARR